MIRPPVCGSLFRILVLSAFTAFGAAAWAGPTQSTSGLRMTRLRAEVRVVDGVATTLLHQVIRNERSTLAEAVWILPLPENAVADAFSMKVAGVEQRGEVLDAGAARNVYESIVRSRRDPGLLEYLGRGCLRARIFPIPAGGDVEVEVGFRHLLPETSGLRCWSLPIDSVGLPGTLPEEVILDVTIDSRRSLRNVFSPTPGVRILKDDDHHARASYEGAAWPGSELALYYGLSDQEFGLDLLSYRKQDEREGSFMMMISPKADWTGQPVPTKEISFVLDTSGSMSGRKLAQAKQAVRQFLSSMNPGDRFNVIPFSTGPEPFFPTPVPAESHVLAKAFERMEAIEAGGGTNIADALRAGLAASESTDGAVRIVVFLTDGQPTVGQVDTDQILAQARHRNSNRARLFVLGVGDEVNTALLDRLADENGGTRDYVREGEAIEDKTGALFTKLSHPVLANLALEVEGIDLTRRVPAELPDLFKGGRLVIFGRYAGSGPRLIRLTGRMGDQAMQYVYEGTFAEGPVGQHDFVPALWAERRIAVLLDAIRMNGRLGELLDEVQRLGIEHNIVTPYTSHLIVEEGLGIDASSFGTGGPRRGAAWQGSRGPFPIPVNRGASGGGGGGPSTPGPSGPSAPGPSGPRSPGPASPGAPGSASNVRRLTLTQDELIERLLAIGVLPEDAPRAELDRLARDIARELNSSSASLQGLGRTTSGATAVDDSTYLARLMGQVASNDHSNDFYLGHDNPSPERRLLDLFSRRIGDKVFHLKRGVWIDQAYDDVSMKNGKQRIETFSEEYFEFLRERPALAKYAAFSNRICIVDGGRAFEIGPAPAVAPQPEPVPQPVPDEPPSAGGSDRDGESGD